MIPDGFHPTQPGNVRGPRNASGRPSVAGDDRDRVLDGRPSPRRAAQMSVTEYAIMDETMKKAKRMANHF